MLASKNLLKPADGEPIIGPSKDMVLGVYYLTMMDDKPHKGDGRMFTDLDEAEMAYILNQVDLHAKIKLMVETWYDDDHVRLDEPVTRVVDTTIGRVLFNRVVPEDVRYVNMVLDKGGVKSLISDVLEISGEKNTTRMADDIKDLGFTYATRSGTTIAIADITIPNEKKEIVSQALEDQESVQRDYRRGLLTEQEQNQRIIDIWQQTTSDVSDAVRNHMDPTGNLATMANSGATKGGFGSISQLAGMRGMVADPAGRIIPLPIRSNFREGLTALEYFISTHGSRKGLADTALRTADAGYLTRRLVDVAQDVIITIEDCETEDGIWIRQEDNIAGQPLGTRLFGRLTAERLLDPETGEVLVERDEPLDAVAVRVVSKSAVTRVKVRSPLSCEAERGICARCYGLDLGRGQMVDVGTAVGIIAAQSIGEPGTQLTLRTFHTGGVAAGSDITTGLPRVEELFEARRTPKGEAVVTEISGIAHIEQSDRYSDLRVVKVSHSEMVSDEYDIPKKGWEIKVKDGGKIKAGGVVAVKDDSEITAQNAGRVRVEGEKIIVSYEQKQESEYEIPSNARLIIKDGDEVEAGQPMTEGSLNPHAILRIHGREACQLYLLSEVQKVYRSQGQNINDKHFEVIIRKMMSKIQVTRPGDTSVLPGDLVDRLELRHSNEELLAEGKQPAKFLEVLLGITKASLSTDSFLSAASFQHTIRVLSGAAIAGQEDPLHGLKENVIIGKLIPAGTGFDTEHPDPILEMAEEIDGNGRRDESIVEGEIDSMLLTTPTPGD